MTQKGLGNDLAHWLSEDGSQKANVALYWGAQKDTCEESDRVVLVTVSQRGTTASRLPAFVSWT